MHPPSLLPFWCRESDCMATPDCCHTAVRQHTPSAPTVLGISWGARCVAGPDSVPWVQSNGRQKCCRPHECECGPDLNEGICRQHTASALCLSDSILTSLCVGPTVTSSCTAELRHLPQSHGLLRPHQRGRRQSSSAPTRGSPVGGTAKYVCCKSSIFFFFAVLSSFRKMVFADAKKMPHVLIFQITRVGEKDIVPAFTAKKKTLLAIVFD